MSQSFTCTHDYAVPIEALWADLVSFDALASSMEGEATYEGLPEGEAKEGQTASVRLKRWDWLPLGKWTMHVERRDDENHILKSREHGGFVRNFEHELSLTALGPGLTRYTDRGRLDAGHFTRLIAPAFLRMYQERHAARSVRLLPEGLVLRPIRRGELAEASTLCLHAKAVHGYSEIMLAHMTEELTLKRSDFDSDPIHVAEIGGEMAGIAHVSQDEHGAVLEKLFVAPARHGQGIGRHLHAWAMNTARDRGAARLVIDSDPGAEAFYTGLGAIREGEAESGSIPGRFIPRLVQPLEPAS